MHSHNPATTVITQEPKKKKRRTPEQWQHIIEDQQKSALSQEAYCKQHNITVSSFYKWKNHFAQPKPFTSDVFVEVKPPSEVNEQPTWDVELCLPNGMVLKLKTGTC